MCYSNKINLNTQNRWIGHKVQGNCHNVIAIHEEMPFNRSKCTCYWIVNNFFSLLKLQSVKPWMLFLAQQNITQRVREVRKNPHLSVNHKHFCCFTSFPITSLISTRICCSLNNKQIISVFTVRLIGQETTASLSQQLIQICIIWSYSTSRSGQNLEVHCKWIHLLTYSNGFMHWKRLHLFKEFNSTSFHSLHVFLI